MTLEPYSEVSWTPTEKVYYYTRHINQQISLLLPVEHEIALEKDL